MCGVQGETLLGKNHFYVIVDFYAKDKISFAILSSKNLNLQIQLPNKYREIEVFPESSGIVGQD